METKHPSKNLFSIICFWIFDLDTQDVPSIIFNSTSTKSNGITVPEIFNLFFDRWVLGFCVKIENEILLD